jgi:hypothetical protein
VCENNSWSIYQKEKTLKMRKLIRIWDTISKPILAVWKLFKKRIEMTPETYLKNNT